MTPTHFCSSCYNPMVHELKLVSTKERVRDTWQHPVWMCTECIKNIRGTYQLIQPVEATDDIPYILHVDDDRGVRNALKRRLRTNRFKLISAASGPEALEMATRYPIEAAIVDVWMPGMDGFKVMEKLHDDKPDLPVIILTGMANRDVMEQSVTHGCAGYLEKPFEPADLIAQLDAVIG